MVVVVVVVVVSMCWLQGTGAEWQEEQEESLSEQLESNTHTLPSNPAVPSNLTQNIIYLWWQRPEVRGLELTRSDWNKGLKANNYTDSLLCHRCNLVRIRSFNNKNTKCSSHTRGWCVETTVRAANEYSAGVEVDLARDYKTGMKQGAGFLQSSIPEFEELKYF